MPSRWRWVVLRCCPPTATLAFSGCLSGLESGLDLLLAPGAQGNILAIAGSPLLPLARFLVGLL
jgi:hypothetical protein